MSAWPWKKGFKSIAEVLCESQVTFGKAVLSFNKSSSVVHLRKSSSFGLGLKLLKCTLGFSIFSGNPCESKDEIRWGTSLWNLWIWLRLRTPWEKQFLWYIHCNSFMVVVFSYVDQVCLRQYSPHAVHLLTQKILYPPHHNFAQASRFFVHFLAGTAWLRCEIS